MSVRPFLIEFYLPGATRADQVAVLLERVEAHTLDARPLRDPVEEQPALGEITGVHSAAIKVALSAVVWFLAVAWLNFSGAPEVIYAGCISTGQGSGSSPTPAPVSLGTPAPWRHCR